MHGHMPRLCVCQYQCIHIYVSISVYVHALLGVSKQSLPNNSCGLVGEVVDLESNQMFFSKTVNHMINVEFKILADSTTKTFFKIYHVISKLLCFQNYTFRLLFTKV